MLDLGCLSFKPAIYPANGNNSTMTPITFDTAAVSGASEVGLLILTGAIDVATTAFKVQESSDDSSYSDISSTALTVYATTSKTGTASTGFTALSGSSDNKLWLALIPLGGARKRYLQFACTFGNGTTNILGAVWIVGRLNQSADTATKKGLQEFLYVSNGV